MKLITLFSARLSVLLTKWAVIGVLWLGSVSLVTSSALLMDQFSDWAQRFAGYSTPYAKQKTKAKAANKKAAAANKKLVRQQKQMGRRLKGVKAHSARVRKLGGKVVARNIADASTSMIPIVGGAASVSFALWDVYAACELIAAQKEFELSFYKGLSDTYGAVVDDYSASDEVKLVENEYTRLEAICVSTTATVKATDREARQFLSELPELPEVELPDWSDMTDGMEDLMCKVTDNC